MTYQIYHISEHSTSYQKTTVDGYTTTGWYSIDELGDDPAFGSPGAARNYVITVLKGLPARWGEDFNEAYWIGILQGNEAAAQAAIQAEQQAALQREREQLAAQTAMLQSTTAQWNSKDVYTAQVAETSKEIQAYNADVAQFLATAPGQPGVTENALLKKPAAQTATVQTPQQAETAAQTATVQTPQQAETAAQTATVQTPQQAETAAQAQTASAGEKKDNTGIIIVGAGVAIAALAALYFAGRKK